MAISEKPDLQAKIRIFNDGKLISEGPSFPVNIEGQNDLQRIKVSGGMSIGTQMMAGDYILQVIVTDLNKRRIATQFVQFEVVE